MSLIVEQFACLQDNYGLLVHNPAQGKTASIDTPDADAILAALERKGWTLDFIFNTHHHHDHTGGNEALKAATGCKVIGPKGEAQRIPALDEAVEEGDAITLGDASANVLNVGGHTLGHIAYHFAQDNVAFVGDCLFALGCGRVFEGTAEQMWASLSKLKALPPATKIYCAHEYTQSNARFAISVNPDNTALQARIKDIDALRANNQPTVPTDIATELATNPFLRPDDTAIRAQLNMKDAPDVAVFAELRHRKDNF